VPKKNHPSKIMAKCPRCSGEPREKGKKLWGGACRICGGRGSFDVLKLLNRMDYSIKFSEELISNLRNPYD